MKDALVFSADNKGFGFLTKERATEWALDDLSIPVGEKVKIWSGQKYVEGDEILIKNVKELFVSIEKLIERGGEKYPVYKYW